MAKTKRRWTGIVGLLIALWLVSFVISAFIDAEIPIASGNVLVISIKGFIVGDDPGGFGSTALSANSVVADIESAAEDDNIDAIVFEINSPGGSAVASDEIAQAVLAVEKPTVSYIREVGASGAYWVAASTDKIFVNRMSITGSIGVIASYLQFSDLLDEHGVTYERMVAGRYKDMGTPFKDLSDTERLIFQQTLDQIHTEFIEGVAENRNMSVSEVRKLATGQVYLGIKAIELGLVDAIGGKNEVEAYLEQELNVTVELFEWERKKSILDLLSQLSGGNSYQVGRGIGDSLVKTQGEPNIPVVWS
jgi:protease-4